MLEKLQNSVFSEIALYFLFQSYDKNSLRDFLKEYSLEEMADFYEQFSGLDLDEEELMKHFDGDYEKIARELALFFAPFLPEDFVINKDLEVLRQKLSPLYGEEISDAIIKALEILSLLNYPYDLKEKEYLLKEVFKIMTLLGKILKLLKA